jgi:DNA end-binding protein Ku
MVPRANWKGFLRLSLVTCPVALYPATSDSEKISFNQLNRQTGHRIKYLKVDADTGEEVPNEDIIKGYMLDKETFIEISKEELDELALESTRAIDIDEFVEKSEIDPRYLIGPYYLRPDGKVGHDAFAVIRETIREMNKVAIGRVVLTNREHIIALEPLDRGLVGTLLRATHTKSVPSTNILTRSRTSKSRRICSIWPSISSIRSPDRSSPRSSKIIMKLL